MEDALFQSDLKGCRIMEGEVHIGELVEFRGSRLFSGAIDLDWIFSNPALAAEAAEGYIFHGKEYHSGLGGRHGLTDTVAFTEIILDALSSHPLTDKGNTLLGIAGYGAGKSHYTLAISYLLGKVDGVADKIIENIRSVDKTAAQRIEQCLEEDNRPFLVVPINGMKNQLLVQIVLDAIEKVLRRDRASTGTLIKYNSEIAYIKSILPIIDSSVRDRLFDSAGIADMEDFTQAVENNDEQRLIRLKECMEDNGFKLQKLQVNDTIKAILVDLVGEICGPGKQYRGILLAFDEFGKYLSFASEKEQVAGMGCMQDLYEGIQTIASNTPVLLLGLSQLDLQEYGVSLGDSASRNNFQRYVSRFSIARRLYLSVCFESLIANLISLKSSRFVPDETAVRVRLTAMQQRMKQYFPSLKTMGVWTNYQDFYRVVFKGCWPLSPLAIWVISYITSLNSILQQRTGLSLIGALFYRLSCTEFFENYESLGVPAVALYEVGLDQEFVASERIFSRRGQEASLYEEVTARYGAQLTEAEVHILQAIVLSKKLMSHCTDEDDARVLLQYLCGEKRDVVEEAIERLSTEFNIIRYDSKSRLYEIASNGISLSQFNIILQDRVGEALRTSTAEEHYRQLENLFMFNPALQVIRDELLVSVECQEFAASHGILSLEWRYDPAFIWGYDYIQALKKIIDDLNVAPPTGYNEAKGRLVYIILPHNVAESDALENVRSCLSSYSHIVPVIVQLLPDENKVLRDSISTFDAIIALNSDEQNEYANLIDTKKSELTSVVLSELSRQKEKKLIIKPIDSHSRIRKVAAEIFEILYPKAVSFNCDGFSSGKSSAPATIAKFLSILSDANVSWSLNFLNQGQSLVNRAQSLLNKGGWGCFDKTGSITEYPAEPSLSEVFHKYDDFLDDNRDGIRIWQLADELMRPPYGMNSLGASLALMVYLNARARYIEISDGAQKISLSTLVSKKYLDQKASCFMAKEVSGIHIVRTVQDDGKWQLLLNRIEASSSSDELLSYRQDMDDYLNVRHIQIPTVLMSQYDACKRKIDACAVANENLKTSLEKHGNQVNVHIAEKSLAKACREFSLLVSTYASGFKDVEPIASLKHQYMAVRSSFVLFCNRELPVWERRMKPMFLTGTESQFNALMSTYQQISDIYRTISGDGTADKIKSFSENQKRKRAQYQAFLSEFSAINTMGQIRDSIEVHGLGSESIAENYLHKLDEISTSLVLIEQKFAKLREAVEQIGSAKDDIEKLRVDLHAAVQAKVEEAEALLSASVSDVSSIRELRNRLVASQAFFQGNAKYSSALNKCVQELDIVEDCNRELATNSLSEVEIDDCVDRNLKAADGIGQSRFCIHTLIDSMANEARKRLVDDSEAWISKVELRARQLTDVDSAKELRYLTMQCPERYQKIVSKRLSSVMGNIESFISAKKVDYVCQLYLELGEDERAYVCTRLGLTEKR